MLTLATGAVLHVRRHAVSPEGSRESEGGTRKGRRGVAGGRPLIEFQHRAALRMTVACSVDLPERQ
eukprot:1252577-Rhodomonas_salina.4